MVAVSYTHLDVYKRQRLTSDTYNIHQMIGMMQRLGVRAPILLLGGVLVTLTLEPVLTLVLLAVLPLIGFVIWRISKKGIPLYGELQKAVDRLIRSVREKASGIRVIKALSKEAYEKERFEMCIRDRKDPMELYCNLILGLDILCTG